ILVAKVLGYDTILHYGSMNWYKDGIDAELITSTKDDFLVTLGGILQTIMTGIIGLILAIYTKNKWLKWTGIFLALFWSREIVNLVIGLFHGIFLDKNFFGGDDTYPI
ncbi:MAG: hypothetical protein ACPG4Z_03805, partial [Chitinophagales bacterium]